MTAMLAALVRCPLQLLLSVSLLLETFPQMKHAAYLWVTTIWCVWWMFAQPWVLGTLKCPSGLVCSTLICFGVGVILAALRRRDSILLLCLLFTLYSLVIRLCCCLRPSLPSLFALSPMLQCVLSATVVAVCCVGGSSSCVLSDWSWLLSC